MINETCEHGDPEYGQFKFNCPICCNQESIPAQKCDSDIEKLRADFDRLKVAVAAIVYGADRHITTKDDYWIINRADFYYLKTTYNQLQLS